MRGAGARERDGPVALWKRPTNAYASPMPPVAALEEVRRREYLFGLSRYFRKEAGPEQEDAPAPSVSAEPYW